MKEIVSSPGGEPELVFQTESPGFSDRPPIPEYVSLGEQHSALAKATFEFFQKSPQDDEVLQEASQDCKDKNKWGDIEGDWVGQLVCEQIIPLTREKEVPHGSKPIPRNADLFPGILRKRLREIQKFYQHIDDAVPIAPEVTALASLSDYFLRKLQEELQLTDFELEVWTTDHKLDRARILTPELPETHPDHPAYRMQTWLERLNASRKPPKTPAA